MLGMLTFTYHVRRRIHILSCFLLNEAPANGEEGESFERSGLFEGEAGNYSREILIMSECMHALTHLILIPAPMTSSDVRRQTNLGVFFFGYEQRSRSEAGKYVTLFRRRQVQRRLTAIRTTGNSHKRRQRSKSCSRFADILHYILRN